MRLGFDTATEVGLLAVGAFAIYVSTNWLVDWLSHIKTGFISVKHLGWLSGFLMVLPNAVLAFYYAWRKQPEIVYTSQVGDAHISIPLCLGIYALYHTMTMPVTVAGDSTIHFEIYLTQKSSNYSI